MRIKTFFCIACLWTISFQSASSQVLNDPPEHLFGDFQTGKFNLLYYPSLKAGTHVNEISYHLSPAINLGLGSNRMLQLRLNSSIRRNFTNLGIPGPSTSTVNKLSLHYSFGEKRETFADVFFYGQFSSQTLGFYYMHYGSTDQTSQFAGGIEYQAIFPAGILNFRMENDAFAFLGLDEFRTAGLSADYRFIVSEKLVGAGLGLLLWTGTTKGLANLDFGQQYDMSNQYGADYSHGILYFNVHYEFLTFSFGYDAESIRTSVQDSMHELIDDGTIAGGSQQQDRFFFQVSIAAWDFLY